MKTISTIFRSCPFDDQDEIIGSFESKALARIQKAALKKSFPYDLFYIRDSYLYEYRDCFLDVAPIKDIVIRAKDYPANAIE